MHKLKADQQKLLAGLRKADPASVKKWFDLFYPELLKIAVVKLSSQDLAEELVQETFIHSLKQLTLFRGDSSLMTWMQSILRHEISDYYRKQYAKKAIRTVSLSELILNEPIRDSHEVSAKVSQVLSRMVNGHKELLLLKYVDKKRVKQIAADLGRSVKSVESELFRAREEFRELYIGLE
ncbi:MAG: RNA polymerase sigma factor [Patescibacteria group bacterium]